MSEVRLIDANALSKVIEWGHLPSDMIFVGRVLDRIEDAPTIEQPCMAVIPPEVIKTLSECVVDTISSIDWKTAIEKFSERKTGHWFLLDECSNEGVYCSNCHKKVYRVEYANQKVKSNYCPNCGADMRGEKND